MTNALCLKCQHYKPFVQYYSDPPIDHVISTAWRCDKGLTPKEGDCKEYEVRHGADKVS